MYVEIAVAVNYILSHLYTKLPRRRVDSFGEELERYLHVKFQHHWFPNDPLRDSAYRCINSVGPQVDHLLPEAAAASGLEWSEIEACLPESLIISIDPGHVACQYNQPNWTVHDKFPLNYWASSSISLSSSGYSSASSSISSSNLTNSSQITHQVLYSLQDGWNTNNPNSSGENKRDQFKKKQKRFENDHGDLLSTAAALSVLVEPEEAISGRLEPNSENELSSLAMNHANWNTESSTIGKSLVNQEEPSRTVLNGVDIKPINPLQTEIYQKATSAAVGTLPWNASEDVKDSFLSMLSSDLVGETSSTSQSTIFNVKTHTFPTFHRSSSNPPQTGQLTASHGKEFIVMSSNCTNSNLLCSKFEQPFNQIFTNTSPKSYPTYIQPLNSTVTQQPFVQKSTSTPSFTAATFAQTKFGSTKLKNHSKRTPTRILSPTTVQQTIVPNTNFLPNDSIPSNLLSNNQHFDAPNSSNISAFRCFLPMNNDTYTTKQPGCISMNGTNISNHKPDFHNVHLRENGNSTSNMKFLPTLFHHDHSNNDNFPISNLENYFSHSSEEISRNSVLDRIHLNEVHNGHTGSSYWQSSQSLLEKHLEAINMTLPTQEKITQKSDNTNLTNLGLYTNWNNKTYHSETNTNTFNISNHFLLNNDFKSNLTRLLPTCSFSPVDQHQIQQQQQANTKSDEIPIDSNETIINNYICNNSNTDCLLDDVLLSTQMVNLLLEEDNLTYSSNHENMFNHSQEDNEVEGFINTKNSLTFCIPSGESTQSDKTILTNYNNDNDNNNHLSVKHIPLSTKFNESNLIHTSTSIATSSVTDKLSNTFTT
ncbi:Protein Tob1 [Schistosoma japonicum]|uniref:Protein Tob1 n=1 Tax=Schistosoma japonicum TaxID=6182 RepID=A0A4Z2DPL1_SCHJA|nr:Protein Tob1 [Schistosoma japonicum]